MAAHEALVMVYSPGIDASEVVNVEVDFDQDEAREILGFMDRYHLPTYADAIRLMTMLGAGMTIADPTGQRVRQVARIFVPILCVLAGMAFDHDFGW